jgi:hypothetical protein
LLYIGQTIEFERRIGLHLAEIRLLRKRVWISIFYYILTLIFSARISMTYSAKKSTKVASTRFQLLST